MLQQVRKTESSIINCLIFLNILMVFWFVFFLIMIIKQKEKKSLFWSMIAVLHDQYCWSNIDDQENANLSLL